MNAEQLRLDANEHYRSGRYAQAVEIYTRALEYDPRNTTLLNNRSAAHVKNGHPELGLDDANKSTGVEPTAKGYTRVAEAYWALGKFESAVTAYERALTISPGDATLQSRLEEAKRLEQRQQDNERQQQQQRSATAAASQGSFSALLLDGVIIGCAVVHVVMWLLNPALALRLWSFALLAMGIRQYVILRATGFALSMDQLRRLVNTFCGQYLLLCIVLWMTQAPPQFLLLCAMVIYAFADIVQHQVPILRDRAPGLFSTLQPWMDRFRAAQEHFFVNAAMCELVCGILIPLSGGSILLGIVYLQFLKYRYRTDTYSQFAFRTVAAALGKVFHHRLCPSLIGTLYSKFCGLMHTFATA